MSDGNGQLDDEIVVKMPTEIPADRSVSLDENQGTIEGGYNQEFNHPHTDRTEPTEIRPRDVAGVAGGWRVVHNGEEERSVEQLHEEVVLVKGDGRVDGEAGDYMSYNFSTGEADIIPWDQFGEWENGPKERMV